MAKLKVGIIGCGTIGREIAKACQARLADRVDLFAICDIDEKKALDLMKDLKASTLILKIDELIEKSSFVVEAASAKISADVLGKCVSKKRDCLIMSVGGLLGSEGLLKSADGNGIKVYIPSGAICGLDGLKAAGIGNIDSVTLTTRKPPKGLVGAPYLKEKNMDVMAVKKETVVFDGNTEEAVKGFPQNINVAAVLSIAGIGAKKTRVRIITSPEYTKNTHDLEIMGDCGKITTRTDNVPSKTNPKTSELAILSAIATIEGAASSVRIGT